MSEGTNHARILHNRYCHLLMPITSLEPLIEVLYSNGILSVTEKTDIQSAMTTDSRRNGICQVLTEKGIAQYVEITELLKNEHKRQSQSSDFEIISTSSTEGEGGTGSIAHQNPRDVEGSEGSVYEARKEVIRDSESHCQLIIFDTPGMASIGKHLKTDVPDPPAEISTAGHMAGAKAMLMMEDSFVKLFFIFIAQQFWKRKGQDQSAGSSFEDHLISIDFPWLKMDVTPEECRDFFPVEAIKGIVPNEHNPVELKLSVLLEAFQQQYKASESLNRENQSLQRKGKMYDEVTKKKKVPTATLR